MSAKLKPAAHTNLGLRFAPDDLTLVNALKKKLGVKSTADLIRQGLRALAAKEGVAA